MKIQHALAAILLLSSSTTYSAEVKGKWQEGFSGNAMLLFGVIQSDSQSDSGSETLNSLNDKGETKSEAFIYPVAASQVNYTFLGGNQQFFMGTSNADIVLGRPHFEVGYGQYFEQIGTFKLSYIPGLLKSSTWEDPFLVGSKRQETDQRIKGVRFRYQEILGTRIGFELAVGQRKIDDELSASNYSSDVQSQLEREGDLYYSEFSYLTPLTQRLFLRSSVAYLKQHTKGEAMASDTYTGQLAAVQKFDSSLLTISIKFQYSKFDEIHPIFLETREDDSVGVLATYTYDNIFGWSGVGVAVMGGFTKEMSNLDFYQSDNVILGTGVRYVF
ncbi:DUF2860 family protein [Vibrio sp. E150_018]